MPDYKVAISISEAEALAEFLTSAQSFYLNVAAQERASGDANSAESLERGAETAAYYAKIVKPVEIK